MRFEMHKAIDPFLLLEENRCTLFAGSKQLMKECIDKFLNTYSQSLSQIEEQISHSEWRRVKESTHKIKGVLKLFAPDGTIELCKELESAALQQNPGAGEVFSELQSQVYGLAEVLREFSQRNLKS